MNTDQGVPNTEVPDAQQIEHISEEATAIQILQDAIAKLESEKKELQTHLLRTVADAQNIQRRIREQNEDSLKFATQPLVVALLPVLDNFERTLVSLEKGASLEKVLEGIKAVDRQLKQALTTNSVERISAIGEIFDPEKHEALATFESAELVEGTITTEIEPGYTLHGRIVRPARVQVTKKP